MPLKKGSSQKTVSSNIKELMHDYDRTGDIGASEPTSRKKAQKQAVAIALSKARESGGGKKKPAAKKSTAKKSTARKSTASRGGTAKTSTAKQSTAKKSTARKSS